MRWNRVRAGASPAGRSTGALAGAILAGMVAATGCGGQRPIPAPVPVQQLLSDALTSSGHPGVSVLTATGTGSRRFATLLPRRIRVEMSCRGGHTANAFIDGHDWVDVFCQPGVAGGGSQTFGTSTHLTLVASRHTRWSLVVVAVKR